MGLKVYDFRREEDLNNFLVTPQIRSRLMRLAPGPGGGGYHSHDLGHEIFIVLQGRCLFEIGGEEAEVGPGQMIVALAHESHTLRALGDEEVIMYLSVTPHIYPTHTGRDPDGERHAPRFPPPHHFNVTTDMETPLEEMVDHFAELARATATAAAASAQRAEELKKNLGDGAAEGTSRVHLMDEIYSTFNSVYEMGGVWNDLALRIADDGS